jgi:hypothetical protein
MLFEARSRADQIDRASAAELRALVLPLVSRVVVHGEQVSILVRMAALYQLGRPSTEPLELGPNLELTVLARLARVGREVRLVVAPSRGDGAPSRDPGLIVPSGEGPPLLSNGRSKYTVAQLSAA